jgi:parallel beta-helix repeat protein
MPLNRASIGSILLIVGLILVSFPPSPLHLARANPSILYVPAQYATIQSAVNAAFAGDTILVSSGTYKERVAITKSLNLTGASRDTTIINATQLGPGINVTLAGGVSIQGFTIINTGLFASGILISSSFQITVLHNKVTASTQSNGTYVYNSNLVTLQDNILTGNLYGIAVQGGYGNVIQKDNSTGNNIGLGVYNSTGNTITSNTFRRNIDGIRLWYSSTGNILSKNLIANNTGNGINVRYSGNNRFTDDNIDFNTGSPSTTGILLSNSPSNVIFHNNIRNNAIQAYAVYPPGDLSTWDNATGSALKTDPKIRFVDKNANSVWDFNETVVYDTDNNGIFDVGDIRIASAGGTVPLPGTVLASDPKIKFIDRNNYGARWVPGEAVVYDSNGNGIFDPGEPAIAGVGGNFWSDYKGKDNGARGFALDGIGDTLLPTPCPSGGSPCSSTGSPPGFDWYPLMTLSSNPLNVTATAKPRTGYVPLQVSFNATVAGGTAPYLYSWDFGDGTPSSQQQNPTHTFQSKGNYIAAVTVTDASVISQSSAVPVTVLAQAGALILKVVDQSLNPLAGANITSTLQPQGQTRISAISNAQGRVAWPFLAPGSYTMQASKTGYVNGTTTVSVALNQTTNGTIMLVPPAQPSNNLPLIAGVGVAIAALALVVTYLFLRRRKQAKRAPVK